MGVNSILKIGTGAAQYTVPLENIVRISATMSASVDGGEIAVDVLTAVVLKTENGIEWSQVSHGTEVAYFEGSSLVGKFFVSSVFRISKDEYELKCTSALGLLDEISHGGGVYGSTTVAALLDEIIGYTFSYTVDQAVADWIVGGWLPFDTARANLHRLLLAMGINLLRDENGGIVFGLLSTDSPVYVPDNQIYIGGEVGQTTPVTSVAVTEHQYLRIPAARETLYDSTDGSSGQNIVTVKFGNPHYNLEVSGSIVIVESGDNYAKVQGVGLLTGVPYTHTERIVKVESANPGPTLRELTVTDDGLINPYNSVRVAQRLLDYHEAMRQLRGKVVLSPTSAIHPGKCLSMSNAFGEPVMAILTRMDITASSTVAANISASSGYQAGEAGNTYNGYRLIASDETFKAPTSHLRIILIGGAQGGQGGYNGEPGAGGAEDPVYGSQKRPMYHLDETNSIGDIVGSYDYYRGDYTSGGEGGSGGKGGASGDVLVLDVDVLPDEDITFHIGSGGAAGAANGGIGGFGGATTVSSDSIGTRSSAEGSPSYLGIWDPLNTGETLAVPGADGVSGANGGASTATQPRGWDGGDGTDGGDIGSSAGGSGGRGETASDVTQGTSAGASGGGGGGAAVGHGGGNGGDGSVVHGGSVAYAVYGGHGGNGASADAPSNASYGCGGNGGNGGGGGGNAGGGNVIGASAAGTVSTMIPGTPGQGGLGSAGAAGGAGCALVLWDTEGRTMISTRIGPTVVAQHQHISPIVSDVQFVEAEDHMASFGASAEAEVRSVSPLRIVDRIVFGKKVFSRTIDASRLHLDKISAPVYVESNADAVQGEAAEAEHGVFSYENVSSRSAGPEKAAIESHSELVASTGGSVKNPARASKAVGNLTQHSLINLNIFDAAKSALSAFGSTVSEVAVSIWGRWAWMEGDTLFIDQEFGGVSQAGGILSID